MCKECWTVLLSSGGSPSSRPSLIFYILKEQLPLCFLLLPGFVPGDVNTWQVQEDLGQQLPCVWAWENAAPSLKNLVSCLLQTSPSSFLWLFTHAGQGWPFLNSSASLLRLWVENLRVFQDSIVHGALGTDSDIFHPIPAQIHVSVHTRTHTHILLCPGRECDHILAGLVHKSGDPGVNGIRLSRPDVVFRRFNWEEFNEGTISSSVGEFKNQQEVKYLGTGDSKNGKAQEQSCWCLERDVTEKESCRNVAFYWKSSEVGIRGEIRPTAILPRATPNQKLEPRGKEAQVMIPSGSHSWGTEQGREA